MTFKNRVSRTYRHGNGSQLISKLYHYETSRGDTVKLTKAQHIRIQRINNPRGVARHWRLMIPC